VQVQVEAADQRTVAADVEGAHYVVPHRGAAGPDLDLEQRFDDAEQAVQNPRLGEVSAQLGAAEGVSCLLRSFAGVRDVAGLKIGYRQFTRGELAQLGEVASAVGAVMPRDVSQEIVHPRLRVGHLRR
jgi:hypothetical protein